MAGTLFELLYFLQNRLFTVYCLLAVYVLMRYFRRYLVSVGVTFVVRKKTLFWEIHMGFEQKETFVKGMLVFI